MLTWKIAWRNLLRHKGKSFVVGIILFLGALLMTVGNATIEGAKQGLRENMIERFTGHLVLASEKEKKKMVFFTNKSLKVIADYSRIKQILEEQDFIENFLPMTRGNAMILNADGETDIVFVLGTSFEDYQDVFLHNVLPVEGELLSNGDRGLLIPDQTREQIYKHQNFWIVPEGEELDEESLTEEAREQWEKGELEIRQELILMGFGSDALETDIRLPVKGIVKFKSLNTLWKGITFMDIESFRECFGYITAADNANELSEEEKAVFAMDDAEDIFAEDEVVEETEMTEHEYDLTTMQQQTQRSEIKVDLDNGAYNIVAIKIKPEVLTPEGEERLKKILEDADAGVKVLNWKQAVGEVAQFAAMTQGALSVFVLFIFFVAIIIIMNTLSMAAIERTSEIGMMRAIGAEKWFISKMFMAETSLLSFVFGGTGIVVGIIVVWILAALNISVDTNEMVTLLFGGDTLHPIVQIGGIISGVIQLALVTMLAMLYPIRVARKITPLEAISRD